MLNSAAQVSVMKVVMMMMMMVVVVFLGTGAKAAPTERGFVKPPPSSTHAEKYSGLDPGLKHWLLNTRAATMDGTTRISDKTTTRTMTAGSRAARGRSNLATAGPDKRAQMLKMISALEELQRTYNSTLSSRITIIPRANGRNSGRRNKVHPPAPEGGVKPTTAAPATVDTTASRGSSIPRPLTGRNIKKSLTPQTKKPNKRVCFWKYCSQN